MTTAITRARKPVRRTPRQVMELWLEALRSGKYKQGRNFLRFDNHFCCLGVLCDLAAKDGGAQWDDCGRHMGNSGMPDQCLLDYVGMRRDDARSLADINDRSWSFELAIKRIERNKERWLAKVEK